MTLGFHFLLLAIGEILKIEDYCTPQDVQDYIQNDDAFGVRPPLNDCRLALKLMEDSGFVVLCEDDKYCRDKHLFDWRKAHRC